MIGKLKVRVNCNLISKLDKKWCEYANIGSRTISLGIKYATAMSVLLCVNKDIRQCYNMSHIRKIKYLKNLVIGIDVGGVKCTMQDYVISHWTF